MTKPFEIALYPGDGIGPEVLTEAVRVLERVQERCGDLALHFSRFDWGVDYYERSGHVVPEIYLDVLRPFDAIFLGALGFPSKAPDHVTLEPLVRLRQRFDQYACIRPVKQYAGVRRALTASGEIDMLVVRENSEGEYVSCGGRFRPGEREEVAIQTAVHTRAGVDTYSLWRLPDCGARRKRPRGDG